MSSYYESYKETKSFNYKSFDRVVHLSKLCDSMSFHYKLFDMVVNTPKQETISFNYKSLNRVVHLSKLFYPRRNYVSIKHLIEWFICQNYLF